jgi:hypothetical protein
MHKSKQMGSFTNYHDFAPCEGDLIAHDCDVHGKGQVGVIASIMDGCFIISECKKCLDDRHPKKGVGNAQTPLPYF